MKRRIKNALRLLFSDKYILVTGRKGIKDGGYNIDFCMPDAFECQRIGMFIHNYLEATESALSEVNKIINANS